MHLRSLKKARKGVSLHVPIGTDKEGNEITLIDVLGTEADDVVDKVQLKIEKSKIYRNLGSGGLYIKQLEWKIEELGGE